MGWHCVLIEHQRLGFPLDVTFRNMLQAEFRTAGRPTGCRIYGRETAPGVHIYYFSPEAYRAMKSFVDFWDGYECQEPDPAQAGLEVII